MKVRTAVFFLAATMAAAGQEASENNPTIEDQTPAATQQPGTQEAHRSTLEVKPGQQVIKPKDLWDDTGYFHPFVRMPKYIWQDQKAIWSSPFHTAKSDVKWWLIFGAVTGGLIASDKSTVHWLPNSSTQVHVANASSDIGSAYTLVPLSAGFYFIGTAAHDDHFRETGLMAFEALIDVNIVAEAIKLVADRARPLESNGKGQFEDSTNGRWNSSFPSGHAINTWALASIVAHQYRHKRWVPVLTYALAVTVDVSRVGARKHFPGDVVAGSAMGWFMGDYVYGKRHNTELEKKHTAAQTILDHVHLGFATQ
jgi:membrane-associated phospholipid phosphatase